MIRIVLMAALATAWLPGAASAEDTGLAGMHAWRKEQGRTCFVDHFHYGSGSGATKAAARNDAIKSWQEFTAFEYGPDWAQFRHAASRGISYTEAGGSWQASVEGRPCRSRRR